MSGNSSSSANASSLISSSIICHNYKFSTIIFVSFCCTNILVLFPLCTLVIALGVRRWLKQRSSSTSTPASHSDVFTYHLVAMELLGVFGCAFFCCGVWLSLPWLNMVGLYIFSVTSNGQMLFHILTCVERYLAVVHPITYLGLKQRAGIRIRNASIGCVWLIFVAWFALTKYFSTITLLVFLFISTTSVSFCCISVLHTLIRPGPGDGGKDRDQAKMRAFYTIAAITGTLMFRFCGHALVLVIYNSNSVSEYIRCPMLVSGMWFCLPTGLVLPVMFLLRAGILQYCKSSGEAEKGSQ